MREHSSHNWKEDRRPSAAPPQRQCANNETRKRGWAPPYQKAPH